MIKISIIIATYNRCDDLKACLTSLFAVKESPDSFVEILISDNNSKDGTRDLVHSLSEKFPEKNIRYIFERRQGKSFALNTAIKQAEGEIFAFSDDDVIFEKDWLVNLVDFIRSHDFDAACGRIMPKFHPEGARWLKDNVDLVRGPFVSYDYGTENKPYNGKSMIPPMGANLIVKRGLFDECGDFNTKLGPGAGTFGDDTEISIRWEKSNKKIYYAGTVAVWHPTPKSRMTLKYIADWNKAYGKYTVIIDDGKIARSVTRVAGVPRYLYRNIIKHALGLLCFNRRCFLQHWVLLYRNIGAVKAYREDIRSGCKGA